MPPHITFQKINLLKYGWFIRAMFTYCRIRQHKFLWKKEMTKKKQRKKLLLLSYELEITPCASVLCVNRKIFVLIEMSATCYKISFYAYVCTSMCNYYGKFLSKKISIITFLSIIYFLRIFARLDVLCYLLWRCLLKERAWIPM